MPASNKWKDRYTSLKLQEKKGEGSSLNFFGATLGKPYTVYRYKAEVGHAQRKHKQHLEMYDCLRRVKFGMNEIPPVSKWATALDKWLSLEANPCICPLKQVFVTNEFADSAIEERQAWDKATIVGPASLVFAYEWKHPTEKLDTLETTLAPGRKHPDGLIWHYVAQILIALKHIHDKKLAARVLRDPSRILLRRGHATPHGPGFIERIYLNCLGMLDALSPEPCPTYRYRRYPVEDLATSVDPRLQILQLQDLEDLGLLILQLAGCFPPRSQEVEPGTRPARHYHILEALDTVPDMSIALKNLVVKLISPSWEREAFRSVEDVLSAVNSHTALAHRELLLQADHKEAEFDESKLHQSIWSEMLYKLVLICERPYVPGSGLDQDWAETGDRYLCKLFRDYLFFRSKENGVPHIDKRDVAEDLRLLHMKSSSKIRLVSPDQNVALVVTYKDVRESLDRAEKELHEKADQSGKK